MRFVKNCTIGASHEERCGAIWGKARGSGSISQAQITQTGLNYTGRRLDATGLLYYHVRYYDPMLGRFVSADSVTPDPQNPQNFNRYSYAGNNPLRYNDPTGHWLESAIDIASF